MEIVLELKLFYVLHTLVGLLDILPVEITQPVLTRNKLWSGISAPWEQIDAVEWILRNSRDTWICSQHD